MSYSRADLIRQVLSRLGKLSNDTPSDEDSSLVDAAIDAAAESLSARDIYTFDDVGLAGPSGGAIEAKVFYEFADIVAGLVSTDFNDLDVGKWSALTARAEDRLQIIAAPPRIRKTLQIDKGASTPRRWGVYNGGFN